MIPRIGRYLYDHKNVIAGVVVGKIAAGSVILMFPLFGDNFKNSDIVPLVTNACLGYYAGSSVVKLYNPNAIAYFEFAMERSGFRTNNAPWPALQQSRFFLTATKHGTAIGAVAGIGFHCVASILVFLGIGISGDGEKACELARQMSTYQFISCLVGGMILGGVGGNALARVTTSRMLWG